EKIDFLNATISQIDSLIASFIKNMQNFTSSSDSASQLSGMVKIFRLKEELKDRKLSDQKMMQLQMAVEKLYGFTPTNHPNVYTGISSNKSIIYILLIGVSIVVILNLMR